MHEKVYRSVFGTFSIRRWVYATGPKKKIEYVPTDAWLGLPRGECSYVLEDWQQRLCVKETFAEGVDGLGAILGVKMSVETAEAMNRRLAKYAEPFRLQQPAPPAAIEETFVVATADGTSVPMHKEDRTTTPSAEAGTRQGSTRRAYIGAVYSIEPFVREPQDVWNELCRDQAAARRPHPQGKRLWAEMATYRSRMHPRFTCGRWKLANDCIGRFSRRTLAGHYPSACCQQGLAPGRPLAAIWLQPAL
jgi:hypothetical protein